MRAVILSILSGLLLFSCEQNKVKQFSNYKDNRDSIEYIKRSISFIKQVKGDQVSDSSFVLVDHTPAFNTISCLEQVFKDSTTFSKEDILLLKSKQYPQLSIWPKDLFPNIKFIKEDTVNAIFENKGVRGGWVYLKEKYGDSFSRFSFPIFLRNNTYCLFYSDNNCGGLCGEGALTLYKLVNNKWTPFKSYCTWIS